MSRHTKTVQVPRVPAKPAHTEEVFSHTECGLCSRTTPSKASDFDGEIEWPPVDTDTVNEVRVSLKRGFSYPEGGMGTLLHVDICDQCFTTRLLPWLESQGAKVIESTWDF